MKTKAKRGWCKHIKFYGSDWIFGKEKIQLGYVYTIVYYWEYCPLCGKKRPGEGQMMFTFTDWDNFFYVRSPQYLKAYNEGYEAAKREMQEKINSMVGFTCVSSTADLTPKARE